MTDPMMNQRTLVENTPDAEILREMIGFGRRGRRHPMARRRIWFPIIS